MHKGVFEDDEDSAPPQKADPVHPRAVMKLQELNDRKRELSAKGIVIGLPAAECATKPAENDS